MSLKDCLPKCIDAALSVRDKVGADFKGSVKIIQRAWTGKHVGDGSASDSDLLTLSPTPQIVDCSHDIRLLEGGNVRRGDLILRGISKVQITSDDTLNTITDDSKLEKFYFIDGKAYTAIHVKENIATWDVHIRRHSPQGGENY